MPDSATEGSEQAVNDGSQSARDRFTLTMDTPAVSQSPTGASTPSPSAWQGALAGAVAGGAALAAGEIVASFAAPRPGPVLAVANRVVDEAPTWFVNFGKDVFGLADKPALMIGTTLIAVVVAAILGVVSLRRPIVGIAGIAAFGLLGAVATASDAFAGVTSAVLINIVAVAAGVATLLMLLRVAHKGRLSPAMPEPIVDDAPVAESIVNPAHSRRSFLGWAGVATGGAAVAGVAAGQIRGRSNAEEARSEVVLAETDDAAPVSEAVTSAASSPVAQTAGITPLVVPNNEFYRIDTALVVPQIDPADWSLTIKGMVDNEVTYTYDELLERATTVEAVTLSCVSNDVGGDLVGNAVWQGVPLTELLDEAGVQPGATQIASRSVDDWTCGFPTDLAYDGRTALVAVGMNDEPLPLRHGFPARLVVSGLYGYVSATKWLKEIELTTLEDFDGYWITRGWSKLGPIKTQSRIDVPNPNARLIAGDQPIAGVAWAPDRGVDKVEVLITDIVDGAEVPNENWIEAELSNDVTDNSWRQWMVPWSAPEGDHVIRVRATDGDGITQTPVRTDVAPDGASGWHTIAVRVT